MTAGPREDQHAGQAVSQGEAAAAAHQAAALAQHAISGSTVAVEAASTPDAHAVAWTPADTTAQPTLVPSEPQPVNRPGNHPPPAA
jgi:hypothetical protein